MRTYEQQIFLPEYLNMANKKKSQRLCLRGGAMHLPAYRNRHLPRRMHLLASAPTRARRSLPGGLRSSPALIPPHKRATDRRLPSVWPQLRAGMNTQSATNSPGTGQGNRGGGQRGRTTEVRCRPAELLAVLVVRHRWQSLGLASGRAHRAPVPAVKRRPCSCLKSPPAQLLMLASCLPFFSLSPPRALGGCCTSVTLCCGRVAAVENLNC